MEPIWASHRCRSHIPVPAWVAAGPRQQPTWISMRCAFLWRSSTFLIWVWASTRMTLACLRSSSRASSISALLSYFLAYCVKALFLDLALQLEESGVQRAGERSASAAWRSPADHRHHSTTAGQPEEEVKGLKQSSWAPQTPVSYHLLHLTTHALQARIRKPSPFFKALTLPKAAMLPQDAARYNCSPGRWC